MWHGMLRVLTFTSFLAAMPAQAAIYRVGSGSGCTHATIQAAVGAASQSAEADEIRISQSQTYVQQAILIDQVQGSLTLAGGYATCSSGTPTTGARTVIDGDGNLPVLKILGTRTVTLSNLDIVDGGSDSYGGGIDVSGSDGAVLMLSNTWVRGNQAYAGGGIAVRNGDPQGELDGMQLLLFGNSAVNSNSAVGGAGIYCNGATVMLFDQSYVALNTASDVGGGIYAVDCRIEARSSGINGAILLGNTAVAGAGGGLVMLGERSQGDIYTIDPLTPTRIAGNSAAFGGGVALLGGAQLRAFDINIDHNTASLMGGAVYLHAWANSNAETNFMMQGSTRGAPAAAVNCADPEACNRIHDNQAIEGSTPKKGSAIIVNAEAGEMARATFRGTRLEHNSGETLSSHVNTNGQVSFDGALLVRNTASSVLLEANEGSENSLVLSASTVSGNVLGAGRGVIGAGGECDISSDYRGTHVYRSIIWQEGHPILQSWLGIHAECFRYLVGNDFAGLQAADLVVADPVFADPTSGNFELTLYSPAIDFAPPQVANSTRNHALRVFDIPYIQDDFGPHDLGAYEFIPDWIFSDNFDGWCPTCLVRAAPGSSGP